MAADPTRKSAASCTARRSCSERRAKRSHASAVDQEVPDAADRVDLDRGAAIHQLAPQMVDMDRDGVRSQFVIDAVELLLQHRLGDDPAGPAHQMLEDGALAPGQDQHRLADAQVAADRVEGDVAAFEQGAERALRPAQQRLDAGDDFAHGERLDQIVVGAGVETGDAMLHGVARRQHEDGNGVAPGAHVLQEARARRRRAVRDRG